jgi:hypothetical protein
MKDNRRYKIGDIEVRRYGSLYIFYIGQTKFTKKAEDLSEREMLMRAQETIFKELGLIPHSTMTQDEVVELYKKRNTYQIIPL